MNDTQLQISWCRWVSERAKHTTRRPIRRNVAGARCKAAQEAEALMFANVVLCIVRGTLNSHGHKQLTNNDSDCDIRIY